VFGTKLRFGAEIGDDSAVKDHQVCVGIAIQLFTLGIPCIYYGTEQVAHSWRNRLQPWQDGDQSEPLRGL
jgi:hypothetical protein